MEINVKKAKDRTTIGVPTGTKDKLDRNRAPGQCYDGFICQLLDLWEEVDNTKKGRVRKPEG
jgi:hypothetical protein